MLSHSTGRKSLFQTSRISAAFRSIDPRTDRREREAAMGLKYLYGKSWWEVTRDERFFCQHLFVLIQKHGVRELVKYLNEKHDADLNSSGNWEAAYEACFYRDLYHFRGKEGDRFSAKRTFDLCLFSDDAIVIIEAKAQQGFHKDQLKEFEEDKTQVSNATGVDNVLLAALASSQYDPSDEIRGYFNGPYLTWAEMAEYYSGDPVLIRADSIYEADAAWGETGKYNTGGKMTGSELLEAHRKGEEFYVGRQGGLTGPGLADDIASGKWKTQKYETNRNSEGPPNANWFSLNEFVAKIETKRSDQKI